MARQVQAITVTTVAALGFSRKEPAATEGVVRTENLANEKSDFNVR